MELMTFLRVYRFTYLSFTTHNIGGLLFLPDDTSVEIRDYVLLPTPQLSTVLARPESKVTLKMNRQFVILK